MLACSDASTFSIRCTIELVIKLYLVRSDERVKRSLDHLVMQNNIHIDTKKLGKLSKYQRYYCRWHSEGKCGGKESGGEPAVADPLT